MINDLHSTYQALQNEPKSSLEYALPYYINKQYEFDTELKKECDTSDYIHDVVDDSTDTDNQI